MKKIIFVCKGNKFRSPVAKALYNKLNPDKLPAESYGTEVDFEGLAGQKLGNLPELQNTLRMLKEEEGIDNQNEVCKQLTPEIAEEAEAIVYLDTAEDMPDYLKHNPKVKNFYVPDVNIATYEIARQTKDKIKNLILNLW